MAPLGLTVLLLLAMAAHSSATWCICKDGVDSKTLQKTLDYACGAGADCKPTHQSEPCFSPDTVRDHCSYAVNSYFQKNRQAPTACDFSGTAAVVNSDPSRAGCVYPATASAAATPTNSSNGVLTSPTNGAFGSNNGLSPTGIPDNSHGGTRLLTSIVLFLSMILTIFAHLLL
ncbi:PLASMODESMATA CALLOSE-BINDING PROTEIN 3-like [Andrographis paniculata]|uniref:PLASMODESMATA CALLOSE-BINDING PROTEIN 3-like n=1 Tax=Andrographis paniculata TaxID=175694 RepID=UPI0021E7AF87|nr:PLASMODESMATA CALLOSE-BINDING PROTEIN 3-like [Andrographis paniculata]